MSLDAQQEHERVLPLLTSIGLRRVHAIAMIVAHAQLRDLLHLYVCGLFGDVKKVLLDQVNVHGLGELLQILVELALFALEVLYLGQVAVLALLVGDGVAQIRIGGRIHRGLAHQLYFQVGQLGLDVVDLDERLHAEILHVYGQDVAVETLLQLLEGHVDVAVQEELLVLVHFQVQYRLRQ